MTMSTPRSSCSGNIKPASMIMMSSVVRTTSMFIPNSPSPPSGMAHTEDWLNLSFFRVRPTFLIYGQRIPSRHAGTARRAPTAEMHAWQNRMTRMKRQFNPCCPRRGERWPREARRHRNSQLHEKPSADYSSDEAENHVNDTAEATAARNMTSDPASQETNDNRGNKAGRSHLNVDGVLVNLVRNRDDCGAQGS